MHSGCTIDEALSDRLLVLTQPDLTPSATTYAGLLRKYALTSHDWDWARLELTKRHAPA